MFRRTFSNCNSNIRHPANVGHFLSKLEVLTFLIISLSNMANFTCRFYLLRIPSTCQIRQGIRPSGSSRQSLRSKIGKSWRKTCQQEWTYHYKLNVWYLGYLYQTGLTPFPTKLPYFGAPEVYPRGTRYHLTEK